jgi:hypothetical protein
MYTSCPSSALVVKENFISNDGFPLSPKNNQPPLVSLFDDQQTVLFKTPAVPGDLPGEWTAVVTVPAVKITEPRNFPLLWRFVDTVNSVHYFKDIVMIRSAESRDSESVIMNDDDSVTVFVPSLVTAEDLAVALYVDNAKSWVWTSDDIDPTHRLAVNSSTLLGSSVTLPVGFLLDNGSTPALPPYTIGLRESLSPSLLVFNSRSSNGALQSRFISKLYVITPSILSATMALEDYINKARIANVIPELDYKMSDLLLYLDRGLSLFNSYPPMVTGFNGTAMAGTLLDCWLICSSYYILTAQIQAESAMAFDFSGQSVTLNVDRTSGIESAIGRLEGLIDSSVKPFKKLLVKSGAIGGSGNIKGALTFGRAFGRLTLSNTALTMTNISGAGSRIFGNYPFRRGNF